MIGAAAAAAALAGCAAGSAVGPVATTGAAPTPSAGTAFDMALSPAVRSILFTDEHGRHLTLGSLAGSDLVIADFMTDCQEVCPMTSVNMRDAAAAAAKAGLDASRVRFLEITIDPRRDTVAKLAAYQKLYGAAPNWDFLTASPADIATLWRSLGVAVTKVPQGTPPAKDWLTGRPLTYDLQHQDVVFVVDGRGHERWLEQGTPATLGARPPSVLGRYLNEAGRANLASPQGATWTVADIDGALAWLTGIRVG
jgi:protein SCO1/2